MSDNYSYHMVGHANTTSADNVECADCRNPLLIGFSDGMIYCPVCENYVFEVV